jgi:putative transposase
MGYTVVRMRKFPLVGGEVYHVMNKSIAGYEIFTHESDYVRFVRLLRFFNLTAQPTKFSFFLTRDQGVRQHGFEAALAEISSANNHSQIIAYCLMPTHFHLLARPSTNDSLSQLLKNALNGYARYFNTKYKRRGTLWMSRFKNVIVEDDEQLLHVSRYIHLNPVTAGLVKKPEEWRYSSYQEYVDRDAVHHPLTSYTDVIDLSEMEYRQFTEDQADYQKELALIKSQVLE